MTEDGGEPEAGSREPEAGYCGCMKPMRPYTPLSCLTSLSTF